MSVPWNTSCTRAFCTSTTGASATTFTVSCSPPSFISPTTFAVKSLVMMMFSRLTVPKFGSENFTAYVPTGRAVIWYLPLPSVSRYADFFDECRARDLHRHTR